MKNTITTISPVDGQVYVERTIATQDQIATVTQQAVKAHKYWKTTTHQDRAELCSKAIDGLIANREGIGEEICWQMGRPISQTAGEIAGLEERARHMIAIAWTGIKKSGRGCTLSSLGYESLTRAKSFHVKMNQGS